MCIISSDKFKQLFPRKTTLNIKFLRRTVIKLSPINKLLLFCLYTYKNCFVAARQTILNFSPSTRNKNFIKQTQFLLIYSKLMQNPGKKEFTKQTPFCYCNKDNKKLLAQSK